MGEPIGYNDRFTLTWASDPSHVIRDYEKWYLPSAAEHEYVPILNTNDRVPGLQHEFKGGNGLIKNHDLVHIVNVDKVPAPYVYLSAFKDLFLYYYTYKAKYDDKQKWSISIKDGKGVLTDGALVSFKNLHYQQWLVKNKHSLGTSRSSEEFFIVKKITRTQKIQNVVVLMLENRSYYRLFGRYHPGQYTNKDKAGKEFKVGPTKEHFSLDPPHEIKPIDQSMANGKNDGYITAYEDYYHALKKTVSDANKQDLMGYYPEGFLPAIDEIIKFGYIPTYWYSALPGPTWPNRMFAVSGSSFGWEYTPEGALDLPKAFHQWTETHPLIGQQQWSIFDVLKQQNVSFCIYTADWQPWPLWKLLNWKAVDNNYNKISVFKSAAASGTLPAITFIEPGMVKGSVLNDDHPPNDPMKAQDFIADCYEAVRNGPNWESTLFLVTYDEHGGFFDPEYPPPAIAPDDHSLANKAFSQEGVRVPTLIISPWVKASFDQDTKDTFYDHTSILRFILEHFAPERLNSLGKRVSVIRTIPLLDAKRPNSDFPTKLTHASKPAMMMRSIGNVIQEEKHFDETAEEVETLLREYYPQPQSRSLNKASIELIARTALTQHFAGIEPTLTPYKITIRTGDPKRAGATIFVQLFGEQSTTVEIPIVARVDRDFDEATAETVDTGNLTKIRIFHEGSCPKPGWLLQHITVTNTLTNREWEFECNKRLFDTSGGRDHAFDITPTVQAPLMRALMTDVPQPNTKKVVELARTRVYLRHPDELNDLQQEYLALANYYLEQQVREDAGASAPTTSTTNTSGGNISVDLA